MVNRLLARGVIVALALVLSACSGGTSPTSAPTAAGGSQGPAASTDPIATLEAGARAGGAVNSYGMPDDWTNFGAIWGVFTAKYGLTHSDTDMSSAEEIQKFDAEKNNPVADIGDTGIQFGPVAVEAKAVAPYIPTRWAEVPDYAKDPDGYWMCWYTGTISLAVNTALVPNVPRTWADLKKPEYKGKLGISDPRTTGQGAMLFMAANLAMGGDENNLDPGFKYFKELSDAGIFTPAGPSAANIEKGEVAIGVLWDYNALPLRDKLKAQNPPVPLEVVIPSDGTTQAPYCHIINAYAAHPNAAKLFREYILTDEVQILQAKKYARPIIASVVLPKEVEDAFPPQDQYASVKPIKDWKAAAAAIARLATEWTIEVGQ
jgi:putative spermidine/putrescine transport system substrate-binding protein